MAAGGGGSGIIITIPDNGHFSSFDTFISATGGIGGSPVNGSGVGGSLYNSSSGTSTSNLIPALLPLPGIQVNNFAGQLYIAGIESAAVYNPTNGIAPGATGGTFHGAHPAPDGNITTTTGAGGVGGCVLLEFNE